MSTKASFSMASFPDKPYPSAGAYIAGYREAMIEAWAKIGRAHV